MSNISIGEGTVLDELGTNTMKGYKWIQIDRLAKRYGVKLIDFNAGPHKKIKNEDVQMNIAEAALDVDFFINVPVLKTHSDTRVSLAAKNLKGCPPEFFESVKLLSKQMKSPFARLAFYCRLGIYFLKASAGIGILPLPRYQIYKNTEAYDINHFRFHKTEALGS